MRLLVTCEHAGRQVPPPYRHLFEGREGLLATHRAWDRGSLGLAREIAGAFAAPLLAFPLTRLLVDANRSPRSRSLFSSRSRALSPAERDRLLRGHYLPYRRAVEEAVASAAALGGRCLHLSVHTFTPVLRGVRRRADAGLLYDPARRVEAELCRMLQGGLAAGGLRVRRNYPYRGTADGMTTSLRGLWGEGAYLGVELEVNLALAARPEAAAACVGRLVGVLRPLLD